MVSGEQGVIEVQVHTRDASLVQTRSRSDRQLTQRGRMGSLASWPASRGGICASQSGITTTRENNMTSLITREHRRTQPSIWPEGLQGRYRGQDLDRAGRLLSSVGKAGVQHLSVGRINDQAGHIGSQGRRRECGVETGQPRGRRHFITGTGSHRSQHLCRD